jgi:uncharacterized protein YbjT (DUF2867 family)
MILVTGANGRVGRLVVAELIETYNQTPAVFVRDRAKATEIFGGTVQIRTGDLDDRLSVEAAIADDVTAVFLCSPVHPGQITQHGNVIDAAADRGDVKVVKLSGLATFEDSFVDSGRWHAMSERHLKESGVPFTCLHPYFFMQNLAFQIREVKESGVLRSAVPDAPIAMIDVRDIAAVAAKLLVKPQLGNGETLPLTCADALSHNEIAELMSQTFGSSIQCEQQDLAELEHRLRLSGQPEWHIKILMQFNQAFSEGYGSHVNPAASDILGRAPRSVAAFLQDVGVTTSDTNPFPS